MDAGQIIIRPVVSEKSYALATIGKYTFRVHQDAHKTQIKQAVEELFPDVKVLATSRVRLRVSGEREHVREIKLALRVRVADAREPRGQGGPVDKLHRDEVDAVFGRDVVDRDDAGMIQRRSGPGFLLESVWGRSR